MLSKEKSKSAMNFFKNWWRLNDDNEFVHFSEMSFTQKRKYCSEVLRDLLADNPNDLKIQRFVSIGEMILLWSIAERILFTLREEKNSMFMWVFFFVSLLLSYWNTWLYIDTNSLRTLKSVELVRDDQ
jgi:hypothetical protein